MDIRDKYNRLCLILNQMDPLLNFPLTRLKIRTIKNQAGLGQNIKIQIQILPDESICGEVVNLNKLISSQYAGVMNIE